MTPTLQIIHGDALEKLRWLPSDSVHCCITSPPYYGLRDYGTDRDAQLGLEPSLDLYLVRLVAVFDEVRRVLHPSGICFIDIGDCYASGGRKTRDPGQSKIHPSFEDDGYVDGLRPDDPPGIKPKDRMLVPFRLALALQSAGWWVRDIIVFHKPAPMPESVTDRCTQSWEPILMLTKSARYLFDPIAIAEPVKPASIERQSYGHKNMWGHILEANQHSNGRAFEDAKTYGAEDGLTTRNPRNVWSIGPEPFTDFIPGPDGKPIKHYASFPSELPRRCILAGTSSRGVCPQCGEPWTRLLEKIKVENPAHRGSSFCDERDHATKHNLGSGERTTETRTIGWSPGCRCEAAPPIPATVLDPFGGVMTTACVAMELGRSAVMIELNPAYIELGKRRLANITPGLQLA